MLLLNLRACDAVLAGICYGPGSVCLSVRPSQAGIVPK